MSGRPGMHGPCRKKYRVWMCPRCGRMYFLIGRIRDASRPMCVHAGTVLVGRGKSQMRRVLP